MAFGARPWLLPAAALSGVLVAAVLATVLGMLHVPATAAPRPATGTIVESRPCAVQGARDTVVFVVDGWSYRLPLDACGNPEGIQVDVEMLATEGGEPAVRLAGTGEQPRDVGAERVGALLLVLAGLSGALLVVLVSPNRLHPHPARTVPTAPTAPAAHPARTVPTAPTAPAAHPARTVPTAPAAHRARTASTARPHGPSRAAGNP